jgi:hypothetical protein
MAATSHDMTAPRPEGVSGVYTIHGIPDPTALTLAQVRDQLGLRMVPPDMLAALETSDPALRTQALQTLTARDGTAPVGAVGFDDWWNTALAALNPHWPLAAARGLVTDKARLYTALAAHGVPVPDFITGPLSGQLLTDALAALGPRPVLKPSTGDGSRGVFRCHADQGVDANLALYRQHLRLDRVDPTTPIIATQYLGGQAPLEVSVDAVICQGRIVRSTVHEKATVTAVHPYVDRIMISPPVDPAITTTLPLLEDVMAAVVTVLALTDGVVHTELRLHEYRWHVLDVGVRPGAGLISHAVLARTGIDPRLIHSAACLNRSVSPAALAHARPTHAATCIACCYITPNQRPQIQLNRHAELAVRLRDDPAVIGWHLNVAETADEVYLSDAGLSIGIGAPDPAAALDRLHTLIEPYAFTTSTTEIVPAQ